MRKYGFSYLELLLSLTLIINLFVIFNIMFYQLQKSYSFSDENNKEQVIENYVMNLQFHLNRASTYEITDHQITLTYNDLRLVYFVRVKDLTVTYNSTYIQILKGILSITFVVDYPFINITIIGQSGEVYEKRIIFIPRE